jgi:hypothetical protein
MDEFPANEPIPELTAIRDPEPGRPARREFWLGLLLVLGVLIFAAGDWWHQETQARTYAAGEAAARSYQWDAAAATFAGLGSYRDAPARAQAAATQVARRNAAYTAGLAAATGQDWLAAARAFSATLAIAPGYRDAAPRYAAATGALSTAALTGIIVRQSGDGQPGLYTRLPGVTASVWLPHSDARSRVRAADSATGRVVYDGGDPEHPQPPTSTALFRRLHLAEITAQGVRDTLLEAWVREDDEVILGRAGVWWTAPRDIFYFPITIEGYVNKTLSYQGAGADRAQVVTLPDSGWGVLDVDPMGGRLLLGEYDGLDGQGVPHTRLYLAGPTGADPHPLALVAGLIREARFSPTGEFVLYDAYETRDRGQVVQRATLVAVDLRTTPPREQPLGSVVVAYGSEAVPVAGAFLPGARTPRLLVKLSNGLSASFSVRDLATGQQRRVWEGPTHSGTRYWLLPGGDALIAPLDDPAHPTYHVQSLDPAQSLPALPLPTPPGGGQWPVLNLTVQGGYAVYTLEWGGIPAIQAVYAVPLAAENPTRLLTRDEPSPTRAPQHLLLPAGLLAYVAPDAALHLQTLDAAFDLPTLPTVDAIWPFGVPVPQVWQP